MKKVFTLLLTFAVVLSLSVSAVAASGNSGKSTAAQANAAAQKEKHSAAAADTTSDSDSADETDDDSAASNQHGKQKSDKQKQFRTELNAEKKELQQQKSTLSQQKEALEAQYEAMLAAGDTEGAAAILESIHTLDGQMQELQVQIKQTIRERYMVAKTMYSDEELAQFDSAADLISQMYEDAKVFDAGCIAVNNNLIKFDAPAYAKGGVTVVPLRAIAEQLDADVTWDGDTQTVTVSKDDTVVKLTVNSTTVLINGTPSEMSLPANVTCGRTYLPLRFLAEALDFHVTWDGENELIDIDDGTSTDTDSADTDSTDTDSADTDSADTDSADTDSADTDSADTDSADTGSADAGSADAGSDITSTEAA
ncbi:MAG: stalk domain-containing protein [Intestinimonas sp.]|jgi:hypothetical protein|nr:stalk domain-containing protein [Intestinimonas sp.]